jgi:multicomponent Na+:H+ antiporter subunit G
MNGATALDVVAAVLMIAGAAFTLAAAVGVLRFRDVLGRMHAATKPQTLGIVLVLAGAGVRLRDSVDLWMIVLVIGFQLLTAPTAAHLVGRLGYRTRHVRRDRLHVDELAADPPQVPGGAAGYPPDGPPSPTERPGSGPGADSRP